MTGLSPKKPGRPRKHASNAVKQLDDQTLSPIDSVALISMRPPKTFQKSQVLDPCWTLERNSPELDVPHSARFQFRRSRISKSSRQDPTATPLINTSAFGRSRPAADASREVEERWLLYGL
jgi:hypothetical protein